MIILIISNITMALIVGLDIYSKVPQIKTLIKYKVSTGVSVKSYILWLLSALLYILYCVLIGEVLLLIETLINIILNMVIVFLAWKYKQPQDSADDDFEILGYVKKEISKKDKENHVLAKFVKDLDVKGEKNIITFYEEFVDCSYHYKDPNGEQRTSSILLKKEEILAVNKKMAELNY